MITGISVYQNNFIGACRLLAIHGDLIFLFKATYSGTVPDYLVVELTIDGVSYLTGKAIYYDDISNSDRLFIFNATEFVKALMSNTIDDFEQSTYTLVETNISNVITIVVKSDISGSVQESFQFEALNAVRQNEEELACVDVFKNSEPDYLGFVGEDVYVYFYGDQVEQEKNYALDYDDGIFLDYNNYKFTID